MGQDEFILEGLCSSTLGRPGLRRAIAMVLRGSDARWRKLKLLRNASLLAHVGQAKGREHY